MENLKEYWKFYFKGLTKGQIKKKQEIKKSFKGIDELLSTVIEMNDDKFIYIPKEQMILPDMYGKEISPNTFKKRYKTINIPILTKEECLKNHIMPQQKIIEMCERFYSKKCKEFSSRGISWTGRTDNRRRVVLFYDLFLGWKLFSAMKRYNNQIKVKDYKTKAIVIVLSKSNPYAMWEVDLNSLPITKINNEYCAEWVNLHAGSTSPGEPYRPLVHKYIIKEVIFSSEKIAAYLIRGITRTRFKKEKGKTTRKKYELEQILANPFMAPTKSMVKIINKLENNVLCYYEKIKNNNAREKSCRRLNQAEKTNLISWAIHLLGVKNSFIHNELFDNGFIDYVSSYMLQKPE
ncbi:hypothetical protein COY26_05490 [Candidatus Woesearchaeota archaeon CG_4_10_14_0_2_um_filter_33_10]|nr:MAG: hypothetical protein COS79_02350 [Candidatus Woesearchaeota archaeon CG06_land_8_20_14_3_00_33_13]PIZ51835.1 MAG: hypothetical protein COY26_05490 [Candidatus Woesearchaeota archaeon CG_4_10_14_0_2_um_filter_33_10]